MKRRETGIGPAALQLHKQGFFGGTGEITCAFECAISATRALFFLELQGHVIKLLQGPTNMYSKKVTFSLTPNVWEPRTA